MDERARRIAKNEVLFRALNERLEELNESFAAFTGTMTIVCECGDEGCIEQLTLTPSEYERVRADPKKFVVKPGHEEPDLDVVVAATDRFSVVEKRLGEPAELAIQHDPRHSQIGAARVFPLGSGRYERQRVEDEAWLRRLLEGGQRALAKARETNPHELQPLIDDLQRLCDNLERRLEALTEQSDDA